jgi:hypothetical protein
MNAFDRQSVEGEMHLKLNASGNLRLTCLEYRSSLDYQADVQL